MKKSLLVGAGCAAVLCVAGTAAWAGHGSGYSDVYSEFATPYQSQRGAMGPMRTEESATMTDAHKRYEGDLYEAYRLPSQTLKGAMGPIRTAEVPSDVAATEAWWKETKHRARILGDND